ncbi:MAG: LysR family transcriptional regulator [Rhizobium sp.]|nr:LysR family transcriptional regulator [Rhizobium sp.]
MQDLNDLFYFARIVEHGGFAPAGRALGVPKSTLSRRIALLEERLGSRLLQRSTRHFGMTEIGETYYRHCVAMIAEAEAAQEAVDTNRAEPRGSIRVTCPVSLMMSPVAAIVSRYLVAFPLVRVQLSATNRRVDVIEEGVDVALRVRFPPLENEGLVMKRLADSRQILVASPVLLDRLGHPKSPSELSRFPGLDLIRTTPKHSWEFRDANAALISVPFEPRFTADDMFVLRQAVEDGVGVAQLPDYMVAEQLASGALESALPEWSLPIGIVHAVFPSRRGLSPTVRSFVDFLATSFRA